MPQLRELTPRIETWTCICQRGHGPQRMLNASKTSRVSLPWTWSGLQGRWRSKPWRREEKFWRNDKYSDWQINLQKRGLSRGFGLTRHIELAMPRYKGIWRELCNQWQCRTTTVRHKSYKWRPMQTSLIRVYYVGSTGPQHRSSVERRVCRFALDTRVDCL